MASMRLGTCALILLASFVSKIKSQGPPNLPPTFFAPIAVFTPNEEQPAGTAIGAVEAIDFDEGDVVRYYIGSGTINANNFDVNETTGVVSFEQQLDREALAPTNEPLLLFIRATDDRDHGTPDPQLEIRIFLRDINDNSPQFMNLPRTVSFPENTNEGATLLSIAVTDRDTGANAQLQYAIGSIDGESCTDDCMFSIRQSSGIVILETSLDFETARQHTISIMVQDRGIPSNQVAQILTVSVEDVNDQNPAFQLSNYFAEIHENLTLGSPVIQVIAIDQDFGVDDDVVYEITSGNLDIDGVDSFAIDNDTGVIYINTESLDRETYQQYTLTVMASEVNDPTKIDTVRVHITIFDINDHSPIFVESAYSANISENQPVQSVLITVTAMDRDFGINADFRFEIVNLLNSSIPLPFRIDHNQLSGEGRIVLIDQLDYEIQTLYIFQVIAVEVIDNSPHNGSTIVSISVINENDNAPSFINQTYSAVIPENVPAGTFVATVRANDNDVGIFGEVEYSFQDIVVDFNISSTTGLVVTAMELDYEMQNQYILPIRANDLDPELSREDTVQLIVNLENLNDNPPQFVDNQVEINSVELTVPEEVNPPLIIYTFDVLDLDGDLNEHMFEIVGGNVLGHFEIERSQLLTTVALNYDLRTLGIQSYDLTVSVNDTEHIDFLQINILVQDVNDNDPMFTNETYEFAVRENEPVGTTVGVVFAEDIDTGTFGEIVYSISGFGSENFEINVTSGVISTSSQLDREQRAEPFNLLVIATDQDESVANRNQVSVPLVITVLDENDNTPVFAESTYIFEVEENTDFILFRVSASDRDISANGEIMYAIVDGNIERTFLIDEYSGIITRNFSVYLDRERVSQYTLDVSATDRGEPSNTATVEVIINVLDVNDVIPAFTQTVYNATIREDVPTNSIVTDELMALDDDTNEFGQITYFIMSVTAPLGLTGSFIIAPSTGVIRTIGTFDREIFPGPYTIMVQGSDGGFPVANNGTAILLVYIEDANDNRPIFSPVSYRHSIEEELPIRQPVTIVSATDADQQDTPNSEIIYSITDILGFDTTEDVMNHFIINPVSGEILTNTSLDYETIRSYRITVEASDTGEPQRSSNVFVTVSVLDVNDHPPALSLDLYELSVAEDTSVNTRFTLITAIDDDATSNAQIVYSIDITSPFHIDPISGELILVNSLNFESVTNYTFEVSATDRGGLYDDSTVQVTVIDVNDHRPVFERDIYTATIEEGDYTFVPTNLLSVRATDEDSGQLGAVNYTISPATDIFVINTLSNGFGQIIVVNVLDRETRDFYTITVVARDGGTIPESATAIVEISVMDVNDVVPTLEQAEYSIAIPENSIPGGVVARVEAIDNDAGGNGLVLYSFVETTSNFSINELTGEITALTIFDYELQQSYVLTILARDNSTTSPLSSTARFVADIIDMNDNAPIFELFPADMTISEATAIGTEIASVRASDQDSGDNAVIIYQLSNDEGKFRISSSGVIALINSLDREIVDEYNLTITTFDRGQPQMSTTGYLLITVSDENDVVPTFLSDTYSFLVLEDVAIAATVGTVLADDSDLGSNGNIVFYLIEGDNTVFDLNTVPITGPSGTQRFAGSLVNRRQFDYESMSSYSLLIQAINTAFPRHEAVVNVTVTVRDTNDNTPRFSMPGGYLRSVSESAIVGTPVGTVVATDNDGGLNGTVTYMISDSTPIADRTTFAINNETGVISVAASLNFESKAQYNLIVVASDNAPAGTRRSASVNVRVDILDFNERAPEFSQSIYYGIVDENLSVGAQVVVVNATEGDSGSVAYSLVAGDLNKFAIDPLTGLVSTLQPLDRENQDRYVLTVQARDTPGSNALSSFAQVEVTVMDVNDNSPMFSQDQYEFILREHSPVGEVLATVTATDRDAGSNAMLTYSLSTGAGQFIVNNATGEITVASPSALDRETTPMIVIRLTAIDNGGTRLASTVPITVILSNINDFSPVFSSPSYSMSIPENSQAGVSIITIVATDGDGDTVTYTIASGDDPAPNNKYTINTETGLIETTSNVLDRESLIARDFTYTLFIEGTDNGGRMGDTNRSTIVPVTITVTDVNDISPQCPNSPIIFMVAEANTLEVRIGQIIATDGDSGTNAVVNYRIAAGNIGGQFRIATTTGDLFALPGLDFETTPEYNLGIAAFDQAPDPTNRRTSTCMVTVVLSDENDNRPEFELQLYEASVVENATIGHIVTVVHATDDDSGSNGDITYSFQSLVRVFAINRITGVITVSGTLDSETLDRYQLDVEATDGGIPRRIGVTQIAIQVVNVNDNSPRFDRSFYSEEVSEDTSVDTTIITITASDSDSPSLTYAIVGGNNDGYFKISTMDGVIQTARNLDREQIPIFDLLVEAQDEDSNRGTTRLQVTISDVNDEAPQFLQPEYFARVSENSPRGTQVIPEVNMTTIRIEAIDSDEPNTQNSRVLYRLAGENSDLFSINFDTGIITVARGAQLDYETLPEIVISVVASDSVPVPDTQSSSVELIIQVLDENDNPPVFTQRFGYVIPVEENHPVGTIITSQVQANDPDTGLGGEVSYSLSNANPLEGLMWFDINQTSGELLLTESLDRESYSVINLMVTGSDQAVPPLSSIVSVQITVGDVNDNAPRFSQNVYTSSVPEFLATGASVTRCFASDPDVGSNGEVEYSLLTITEPFTINPVTGEVTTTSTLDHELKSSHILNVQACDNGDIQQCDIAMVIINVLDFNDETPQFDLAEYAVDVCDAALSGEPLLQPIATDQDSGSNARLTYMLQNEEQWALFAVNSTTGLISLSRDVDDHDVINERHEFNIIATDDGDTSLSGSARVVVRVLNCTERQFTFSEPYFYFEIREGETQFTDGRTGQVIGPTPAPETATFYPVDFPQNPFSINLNLLSLKSLHDLQTIGLVNGLDREVRDLYTVIVRAERQSEITFASVTVRVLDTNDNGPVFQSELYVFNVFENSTQSNVVGSVLAEDRDQGSNAIVSYVVLGISPSGQMAFTINSSTGVITKDFALDRETNDQYILTIQATDGLTTNNTRVVVNVMDVNDCTPTFSLFSYDEPVLENRPAGVVVTTVAATDCDTGSNAVIRYTIVAGDLSVFEVDFVSGEIMTLVVLDYETVPDYHLRIRATDMGSPTLFSEADVNIQVVDFNDCPPEFVEPPPSYTIPEDAILGSVLVDFTINDCDSGLNGANGSRFSIIAGNDEGLFDITEEGGVLFTTAALDRELRSSYLLSIQAKDSATVNRLSSVIQLNVIIDDVNDNAPVFIEQDIFITVGEGEDLSEVLVQGQLASDVDSGTNGQITYSLLRDEGVFGIDANTGVITLINSLDRETTESYVLTIIARDRADEPRSSNATISVTVRDENDNPPVILNITSGLTVVSIEEGSDIGTLVYSVSATDADEGSNGEINFSLSDPGLPFDISTSGGAIFVAGSLDYEARNEYTLVVVATDRGSPQPLSSLARLTVRITDRNDNPPVFEQTAYAGSQNENTPTGTSILSVSAQDNDQTGSVNAQVQYSLISGDVDYFIIDPQSGVISNQIVLDREHQSFFSLIALANNSLSSIPLTSTTIVRINVSDTNDEYPQFQEAEYFVTLNESAPPNTHVVDVNATDGDQPGLPNSDLIYSINVVTNIGNLFHIDPDSGLITLQNSLDHETRPYFELEVVAEDKGAEPLRNLTMVVVNVLDTNDNVPMFTESSYSITIREGSTTPLIITNLQYFDGDSTEAFRRSSFSITSVLGPEGETVQDRDLFSVSTNANDSGVVSLNNPVDYEFYTSYSVSLSVTNDADLSSSLCIPNELPCRLSSTASLDILITDENDNAPEFLQHTYSGEVSSTAPPDTSVLSVRAMDDDRSPEFSTVKYRLDDESLREGKFRIDENTGILFTRIGFEEDVGLSYSLTVTAYDNDGGDPSLTDEALITLLVLDNFQRVAIVFRTSLTTIINKQSFIEQLLENITNLDVVVEQYASYSNETHTQFIFHAIDSSKKIVGFNEFLQRVGDNNYELIFERLKDCNITAIMSFATLSVYGIPPLLVRETIVILVFCLLLVLGAVILLAMSIRQRYVAWTQERLKEGALATNHLFGPGGLEEQGHYHTEGVEEQYELMQKGNFLNPMYVVPVSDPMAELETSAAGSTIGLSSMHKNNPLYESQEISMDMFKEPDYDEDDDIDDDGTDALAAALGEEEEGTGEGGEPEDTDDDIERTMI